MKIVKITDVLNDTIKRIEAEYYISPVNTNGKNTNGEHIIKLAQYGTSEELNEDKRGFPILRLNEFESYFMCVS